MRNFSLTKEATEKVWKRLEHEERQGKMLALCCCSHERLGSSSAGLKSLDENVLMMIWESLLLAA